MDEVSVDEGESNSSIEVAPALIAVHPLEESVAVATGAELRVFSLKGDQPINLQDDSEGPSHSEAIRAISFGAKGRFFASAGDDKLVKVWAVDSWHCIRTVCSEKRVSAVAVSHDGRWLTFADKFGIVWAADLSVVRDSDMPVNRKPIPILAHYCSIITSLEFSPSGQYIVSADRDFKIRVTVFPRNPSNGAHEIQSFCLGHTDFVSCLAFVKTEEDPLGFLLSGSGDSTVRMWDFPSGCLLCTCDVGEKAELGELIGEEDHPAVTDLCASPDGSIVAVAIQSFCGIVLLTCDLSTKSIAVAKVIYFKKSFIPTCLGMSCSAERLWTVTGASNFPSSTTLPLACVKVIDGLQNCYLDSNGAGPVELENDSIPGGEKLLTKLQGSVSAAKEEKALSEAAEAVKTAMRNLLIKKQYSAEKRDFRKRSRNDKKLKQ
ncbi:hypothetical protein H6P81_004878 [Aristolochia fimbriata]|uniref:tRNA (guanine-N(7)-)-methyltransferase non-catalytic subunit n=1 Tax=Aristolochia fimbriata TaxID=158543 RepID=A0AAV7EUB3_ARIFI|nr:hypothetical protein H6P81_004878 [Aristolochia fimbriata]